MYLILQIFLKGILIIIPLLIAVAHPTSHERKVIASMQRRRGPNVVGFFGLLQPLADGLKLPSKETVLPSSANSGMSLAAPIITFTPSSVGRAVMPFDEGMVFADVNIGILYIFAISSLGVYGVLISG